MSITESSKVDGIAIGYDGKTLVMLITDHLDWEKGNEYELAKELGLGIKFYLVR